MELALELKKIFKFITLNIISKYQIFSVVRVHGSMRVLLPDTKNPHFKHFKFFHGTYFYNIIKGVLILFHIFYLYRIIGQVNGLCQVGQ